MNLLGAQKILASLGYPTNVDGRFTLQTQKALAAYQTARGLQETGTLDLRTEHALDREMSPLTVSGAETADGAGLDMVKRASFLQGLLAGVVGTSVAGGLAWAMRSSMSRSEESDDEDDEDDCTCGECSECLRKYGPFESEDFEVVEEDDE